VSKGAAIMTILRYLMSGLLISIIVHLFMYDFADFKAAYDWVMAGQVLPCLGCIVDNMNGEGYYVLGFGLMSSC
jgi:hypothetical protein